MREVSTILTKFVGPSIEKYLNQWFGHTCARKGRLGNSLGILGIAISAYAAVKDVKAGKPTWVAATKVAVGAFITIGGIATGGTGFVVAGLVFGILDATGVIDKTLMGVDKGVRNFFNDSPKMGGPTTNGVPLHSF